MIWCYYMLFEPDVGGLFLSHRCTRSVRPCGLGLTFLSPLKAFLCDRVRRSNRLTMVVDMRHPLHLSLSLSLTHTHSHSHSLTRQTQTLVFNVIQALKWIGCWGKQVEWSGPQRRSNHGGHQVCRTNLLDQLFPRRFSVDIEYVVWIGLPSNWPWFLRTRCQWGSNESTDCPTYSWDEPAVEQSH